MSLPSSIPLRRDVEAAGGSTAFEPWMGLLGFVLLVALALAVVWLRRGNGVGAVGKGEGRRSPLGLLLRSSREPAPVVLASTRLSTTHSLHDIQWQGRRLLIGCAQNAISVLSEMPRSPDAEPGQPRPTDSTAGPA